MLVASQMRRSAGRVRNKAPTVTHNSAYLEALQNWKPRDFLSAQTQKAKALREKTRLRKQAEFEEAKNDPNPVYIYGSQRLNSMALAQQKQREASACLPAFAFAFAFLCPVFAFCLFLSLFLSLLGALFFFFFTKKSLRLD